MPPEIGVAIIGVETFCGRVTGGFHLIDALATLAFDFPPGRRDRSDLFRSELEEFFVLCAREGRDPRSIAGSYAGALGLPQFMPGSVNRWVVDFDDDGHADLLGFNRWLDGAPGAVAVAGSTLSTFNAFVQPLATPLGTVLCFTGPQAMSAYGGPVPVTIGNRAQLGNSVAGLGLDRVPDLMNGVVFYGGTRSNISALGLAKLADTGLTAAAQVVPELGAALLRAGLPLLALALRRRRRR